MSGLGAFARKEVREILRTWRIWVLPSILLFFALTGPVLARYTPQIVGALAADQLGGFQLPTPTYLDAYMQWVKNVSQIALFAVIIIYGGLISGELKSGTATLVLTKPVSRRMFVVVKAGVQSVFFAALILAGTLLTWGLTAAMFGSAPGAPLWSSGLVLLVLGELFIAVMTLLSVLIGSSAGAAGAGLGVYALLSIAGVWKPLARFSPAGLGSGAASLAAGGATDMLWPVVTALVLIACLVGSAALLFRRKDLQG